MPDVYVRVPKTEVNERSSFTANSYYRSGDAAQAPTTAHYRIDCLSTGTNLQAWTALSAASSIDITVTATHNRIIDQCNRTEKKQITVSADKGTSTETRDIIQWKVKNTRGFEE